MQRPASPPEIEHRIAVTTAGNGERLDRWLVTHLPDLSRSRVQALIKSGFVTAAGEVVRNPGHPVKVGQDIVLTVPPPEPPTPEAQSIPLKVVYEDAEVVVIDKPAGLVVHPAAGHASGTLVNALIAHCGESLSGIGGVRRPGIVHRLDKDTSGLLVVAKNDLAHTRLSEQFASHGADGNLKRQYVAICWGVPDRQRGTVNAPLARSATNRTKIAVVKGDAGREAVTHYEVVETFADVNGKPVAALLRLELETGRTHQIRVHMAHLGHPLLGDAMYGAGFSSRARLLSPAQHAALDALGRQALHAAVLGFSHPKSVRKKMLFESALPADLERLLSELRVSAVAKRRVR